MRWGLIAAGVLAGAATVAAAAGGEVAEKEAHLVAMDELSLPIVDGGRSDGTLKVRMVLDMVDADAVDSATAALPALRASALAAGMEFARLYASPMTPVDASRLAGDMTTALHAEDARVTRVLIVEVGASRA